MGVWTSALDAVVLRGELGIECAVPTSLIALHGFTMNGAGLRHLLGDLETRCADVVDLICPDAPHAASEASVAGLASLMGGFRARPPNLEWWNASEDRLTYRGWDATRDMLCALAERTESPRASRSEQPLAEEQRGLGLLGFSQGAAVAASLAALSQRGAFPPLCFVVLVAGFLPRAPEIEALFDVPIEIPSLHVWGSADPFAKHAPTLLQRFAPHTRQELSWAGRHTVPTGDAGDALVEFVRRHA
jgi:predicted esterase